MNPDICLLISCLKYTRGFSFHTVISWRENISISSLSWQQVFKKPSWNVTWERYCLLRSGNIIREHLENPTVYLFNKWLDEIHFFEAFTFNFKVWSRLLSNMVAGNVIPENMWVTTVFVGFVSYSKYIGFQYWSKVHKTYIYNNKIAHCDRDKIGGIL